MRLSVLSLCVCVSLVTGCARTKSPPTPMVAPVAGTLEIDGLFAPVRIIRDRWGVPHIVASTRDDLFFAQGFVQAEDRLFQMDLWRRSAQGRLAEVLGSNFVSRDAMTRRVQYIGNVDEEWASYGPDTKAIASAFVRGINAWVVLARERPPEPFVLAGWSPELWRPEDLLNRTDAFVASGDADAEVFRARLIAAIGARRAIALLGPDAASGVPAGIDPASVTYQVGDSLREIGARPFFTTLGRPVVRGIRREPDASAGSNAWVISGQRSATGAPIVAIDPHRLLANPSLRYLVHLTAPGWNVAGATAPWMPGVAIGHNDRIAWGMTAFDADAADLYVERVNPENSHQIELDGRWQNTRVILDSLLVKGRDKPTPFEREYTPNGVVVGIDRGRHLVFTLRWSGSEAGTAAELAAPNLDRAASEADFRDALAHWKMPAVNVVYAEKSGAIGSQVAALVPIRRGWDGRLPAAGWTGGSRWDGWRQLDDLAHSTEPAAGYLASANGNRARMERIRAALAPSPQRQASSLSDSARLQQDVLAWNAERLVPLFARLHADRTDVEQARLRLLQWDRRIAPDSADATLYVTWERLVRRMLVEPRLPGELVDEFVLRANNMLVPALTQPARLWFDRDVDQARDRLILRALAAAIDELQAGPGLRSWGEIHTVIFAHPLGITEAARRRFNIGPFARGGYAETVLSISGRRHEESVGASFSAVFDTADWDRSIVQNPPGQSEARDSGHFADLAERWAAGESFPLVFTEAAVGANTESTLTLVPRAKR